MTSIILPLEYFMQNTFTTFLSFSWVLSISFKAFESRLVSIDVWHFPWVINSYWKFMLFWHSIIPNPNNSFICFYEKRLFSNPRFFVIKSKNKAKRFIWNVFYCDSTCIYVRINVATPNVIDSDPRRSISFN